MSRRAFLPSYDPTNDDERGTALERVITPALVVCSGISLEYLFSSTEAGAGTKVGASKVLRRERQLRRRAEAARDAAEARERDLMRELKRERARRRRAEAA